MVTTKDAQETTSQKIWEKIRDLDLELFALPDQTVEKHFQPVLDMSPEVLHLVLKTAAALPQLEEKIRSVKFGKQRQGLSVNQHPKFVLVQVAQ